MALRIAASHDEHYSQFKQHMRALRSDLIGPSGAGGWYVALQTGNADYLAMARALRRISETLTIMDAASALGAPFIQSVKDIEGDQAYDVVANYNAMRTAIVAIRDWITTNVPKHTDGVGTWWLVLTIDQNGVVTHRPFTPAQTAPLRALIDDYRTTVT